jgi:hypothetical protein
MSLRQFTSQDFQIINGQKKSLNITQGGIYLIFYKIQGCQGCSAFEPIFLQLSTEDKRVNYGILDLTYNRDIIKVSRDTTTVIEKVPHLILYVQGSPRALFKGEKNLLSLKSFLTGALSQITVQPLPSVDVRGAMHQQPQQQTFVAQQQIPLQQNMYGGTQSSTYVNVPDVTVPSQANKLMQGGSQGAMAVHSSMKQQCDPDDEDCLLMPTNVIPHNMPWESDFHKYMTYGKI